LTKHENTGRSNASPGWKFTVFAMQKHSKMRNVPFPRPCGATRKDAQGLHAPAFALFRGAARMHEVLRLCQRLNDALKLHAVRRFDEHAVPRLQQARQGREQRIERVKRRGRNGGILCGSTCSDLPCQLPAGDDERHEPAFAAQTPVSRCRAAAFVPSSPMLPRTATRRPAGKVAMERSAAAVESGLAL